MALVWVLVGSVQYVILGKVKSAHQPSGPHNQGLSQFLCCSMKWLGINCYFPWMGGSLSLVIPHTIRFPWYFAWIGTHLYSWVERGTVRVKCLAQEHNTMIRPGLKPRPFDLESSKLTIRPLLAGGHITFAMRLSSTQEYIYIIYTEYTVHGKYC